MKFRLTEFRRKTFTCICGEKVVRSKEFIKVVSRGDFADANGVVTNDSVRRGIERINKQLSEEADEWEATPFRHHKCRRNHAEKRNLIEKEVKSVKQGRCRICGEIAQRRTTFVYSEDALDLEYSRKSYVEAHKKAKRWKLSPVVHKKCEDKK